MLEELTQSPTLSSFGCALNIRDVLVHSYKGPEIHNWLSLKSTFMCGKCYNSTDLDI